MIGQGREGNIGALFGTLASHWVMKFCSFQFYGVNTVIAWSDDCSRMMTAVFSSARQR